MAWRDLAVNYNGERHIIMADNFVSSLQTFSLINERDLDLITGPSLFRFDILVRDKNAFFYEEIRYLGGIYYGC